MLVARDKLGGFLRKFHRLRLTNSWLEITTPLASRATWATSRPFLHHHPSSSSFTLFTFHFVQLLRILFQFSGCLKMLSALLIIVRNSPSARRSKIMMMQQHVSIGGQTRPIPQPVRCTEEHQVDRSVRHFCLSPSLDVDNMRRIDRWTCRDQFTACCDLLHHPKRCHQHASCVNLINIFRISLQFSSLLRSIHGWNVNVLNVCSPTRFARDVYLVVQSILNIFVY